MSLLVLEQMCRPAVAVIVHTDEEEGPHTLLHLLRASRRLGCLVNILAERQTRPFSSFLPRPLKSQERPLVVDLAAANIPLSHARPRMVVSPQPWKDWVAGPRTPASL